LEELLETLPLILPSNVAEKKLKRKLTRQASQYGWTSEGMDQIVASLSVVLSDASKKGWSSQELTLSMTELNLTSAQVQVLAMFYERNRDAIKAATAWNPSIGLPAYHDLSWRLDIEIGTRLLHNQARPELTLDLETVSFDGVVQSNVVAADYSMLKTLHATLKDALNEAQSSHCSRIQRYLQ
ncbi:hypothetical protein THRCLA_10824, partial [Thraustotheca clavata]